MMRRWSCVVFFSSKNWWQPLLEWSLYDVKHRWCLSSSVLLSNGCVVQKMLEYVGKGAWICGTLPMTASMCHIPVIQFPIPIPFLSPFRFFSCFIIRSKMSCKWNEQTHGVRNHSRDIMPVVTGLRRIYSTCTQTRSNDNDNENVFVTLTACMKSGVCMAIRCSL